MNIVCTLESFCKLRIDANTKWLQTGITIAGDGSRNHGLNQLSNPWDLCLHDDQTVYVTDCSNNRIVTWKSGAMRGQILAGGNELGPQMYQLRAPKDVIINEKNDSRIINDYSNKRVVL